MTLNLLIAPDFAPERFAGWHMLNTLLQKRSGLQLHLLTPASAAEQAQLIAEGKVDAVYANPFDAASMIRDAGYQAIARPVGKSDEMVIATAAGSAANTVEDLQPGCKIALTDNKDVKLIGLRLLEPADLTEADIQWQMVDTYQAAARMAIKGEVDASFFLAEAYHSLSRLTKTQLKTLMESKLADITHVLLTHPRMQADVATLRDALVSLTGTPDGQPALDELGMAQGFEAMSGEDAEFMIDLMDTLLD
ncbi:MAG TPA: phosphate/phosphite/phosphonate ABC transporter substrate-binding protein [Ottowia sp.]|nr:phosphate/phosphite/phosphonate ABC transporter substrate-binding protein [Ottowia sp.]